MIKVGIIGATGYTGTELVRILSGHPETRIVAMSSHSSAGTPYTDIYPDKTDLIDMTLMAQDEEAIAAASDVVFLALPHGHAARAARVCLAQGVPVVDLGADFRFSDADVYEAWYGVKHTGRDLLAHARYCLPEINRHAVGGTKIVGNPGCYPTSVILGLAPLLEAGVIDPKRIVIDSKSGVSGAGRKLSAASHFVAVNDSIKAYGLATHRHTPEIEEQLGRIAGDEALVNFTPHLVPMTRGILSTMVADLTEGMGQAALLDLYRERYEAEPFVHVLPDGTYPATKWVYGSNHVHIGLKKDERTERVLVVSAIDNLVKGASGQAVQNMNLLFGLDETTGLGMMPVIP